MGPILVNAGDCHLARAQVAAVFAVVLPNKSELATQHAIRIGRGGLRRDAIVREYLGNECDLMAKRDSKPKVPVFSSLHGLVKGPNLLDATTAEGHSGAVQG